MANKGVQEPGETASALLNKGAIVGQVVPVDGNALRRQQRKDTEGVSLVQAVEEPNKVAVPPDDLAAPPGTRHLVVVVLEEEQTLLLGHQRHNNVLLDAAASAAARRRPQAGQIGQASGSIAARVACGAPEGARGLLAGGSGLAEAATDGRVCAIKVAPAAGGSRGGG